MESKNPPKKLDVLDALHKVKFLPVEESSEDFRELEEFPGYAEIHEEIATSNTRSIDQIITEEKSEEEEEDDITQILPVKNALDHVNDLRRLIASFDNANETLYRLNKNENFLFLFQRTSKM
ncbi:hypothetical protein QTP88_002400 [Uroleucon formosanum]